MLRKIIDFSIFTLKKNSLNRILQIEFIKNKSINGKVLEFGTSKNSSKKFSNFTKNSENTEFYFADQNFKENQLDEKHSREDLEKKLTYPDENFDNILVFNVIEHVYDFNNSINEIYRVLKKNGKIIGSVPFLYRVHGAPNDYYRFTAQAIEKKLINTGFKNVSVKQIGYGPFTVCYAMLFDYLKIIPLLNNFVLLISIVIDKILQNFIKTKLSKQYPITVCFEGDKI